MNSKVSFKGKAARKNTSELRNHNSVGSERTMQKKSAKLQAGAGLDTKASGSSASGAFRKGTKEVRPPGYYEPNEKLNLAALYFQSSSKLWMGDLRRAVRKSGITFWFAPGFHYLSRGICEVLCAVGVTEAVVKSAKELGFQHLVSHDPVGILSKVHVSRRVDLLDELYLKWVDASANSNHSGGAWEWYGERADLVYKLVTKLRKGKKTI